MRHREYDPFGESCPGCASEETVLVYELVYQKGNPDPVARALMGAECEDCGLRFVNDDVREVAA